MHAQVMGADPAAAAAYVQHRMAGSGAVHQYLLPFEIAALILTVGVVAAVALTLRQRGGVRHESANEQVGSIRVIASAS
jgi:NADH-quinone oxidoreductase subunit J